MRLAELVDLSEASHEGAPQVVAIIEKLLREIRDLLGSGPRADPYLLKRYPEIVEHAEDLKHAANRSFAPDGLGADVVKSCLAHLSRQEFVPDLIHHLAGEVETAGHTMDDFRRLDQMVSRLDAELVFDGHSQGWRQAVRAGAQERFDSGQGLEDSILGSLEDHHCGFGAKRPFAVLVPLTGMSEGVSFNRVGPLEVEPAITVIKEAGFELDNRLQKAIAEAEIFSYSQDRKAADAEAAVRMVDKTLRSAIGAWRLTDRTIADPEIAFVVDAETGDTQVLSLPSEPLEVRPPGVERWPPEGPSAERLGDALDQLAQARMAPPQTAFVDLWTAADALYGGGARDPSWHAGQVMTGVAQFVYVEDMHRWLASRAEQAGLGSPPVGGEADWFVEQMGTASAVDKALAGHGDSIGWSRFKVMSGWDDGWGLGRDLDRLRDRLVSVCDRAYLIRNFAVHRAEVRGPALEIVLPTFAGMVAAAVGHSLGAETEDTLEEALAAGLEARTVAYDFKSGRSKAPDGLRPLFGN